MLAVTSASPTSTATCCTLSFLEGSAPLRRDTSASLACPDSGRLPIGHRHEEEGPDDSPSAKRSSGICVRARGPGVFEEPASGALHGSDRPRDPAGYHP